MQTMQAMASSSPNRQEGTNSVFINNVVGSKVIKR